MILWADPESPFFDQAILLEKLIQEEAGMTEIVLLDDQHRITDLAYLE